VYAFLVARSVQVEGEISIGDVGSIIEDFMPFRRIEGFNFSYLFGNFCSGVEHNSDSLSLSSFNDNPKQFFIS